MSDPKWNILGSTLIATAMLAGCGGGGGSSTSSETSADAAVSSEAPKADVPSTPAPAAKPSADIAPPPSVPAIDIAPLAPVPPVVIAPPPAAPAVNIAPQPSVAPLPSTVAPSAKPAANEESSVRSLDFTGAINTYPASSVIKFLIQSVGSHHLGNHLQSERFAGLSESNSPLNDLRDLVSYLRKLPASAGWDIQPVLSRWVERAKSLGVPPVVDMKAARQLYLDAYGAYAMEDIKYSLGGLPLVKKSVDSHGVETEEEESTALHLLTADRNGMDLQTLVNSYTKKSDAPDSSKYEFQMNDNNRKRKISFMVAIGKGVKPGELDFGQRIEIPVVDKQSGKKLIATLYIDALAFKEEKTQKMTNYHRDDNGDYVKSYSAPDAWDYGGEIVEQVFETKGRQVIESEYPSFISFTITTMAAGR